MKKRPPASARKRRKILRMALYGLCSAGLAAAALFFLQRHAARAIQNALRPHFNMQSWKTDPRIVKEHEENAAENTQEKYLAAQVKNGFQIF